MGFDRGPAFDAWFARACAVRPEDRFPTAVEQVEALAAAIAARPNGRRRTRAWVAVAVGGAMVASVWAVTHRGTAASSPAPVRAAPVTPLAAPPAAPPPAPAAVHPPPADPPWEDSTTRVDPGQRPRRRKRVETTAGPPAPPPRSARDGVWDEP
jgi:hypothetical protein